VIKASFAGHSRFIRTGIKHKATYNCNYCFSSNHVTNKKHLRDIIIYLAYVTEWRWAINEFSHTVRTWNSAV